MAQNLYHSALAAMGQVHVTVKAGPTKSKFPNKPDYFTLAIGNIDYWYQPENANCHDFFNGRNGQSFLIQASGRDAQAVINYVGPGQPQPGGSGAPAQQAPAQQPPQQNMPPQQWQQPPAQQAYQPPQQPAYQPPQQQMPPQQAAPTRMPRSGQMVGACVNKAVDTVNSVGIDFTNPDYSYAVSYVTEKLIKIHEYYENGGKLILENYAPPSQAAKAQ